MIIYPRQVDSEDKRIFDECFSLVKDSDEFDYRNSAILMLNHPKEGLIRLISGIKSFKEGRTKRGGLQVCHAEREILEKFNPELICSAYGMSQEEFLLRTRLYSLIEPCYDQRRLFPESCSQGIVKSGIKTVVFAYEDPNHSINGAEFLSENGVIVRDYSKLFGIAPEWIIKPFDLKHVQRIQEIREGNGNEESKRLRIRKLQQTKNWRQFTSK